MNNKKLFIVVAGILIVAVFVVSSFVWSGRMSEPVAMHLSLPKETDKNLRISKNWNAAIRV